MLQKHRMGQKSSFSPKPLKTTSMKLSSYHLPLSSQCLTLSKQCLGALFFDKTLDYLDHVTIESFYIFPWLTESMKIAKHDGSILALHPATPGFDSWRSQKYFSLCGRDFLIALLRTVDTGLIMLIQPI